MTTRSNTAAALRRRAEAQHHRPRPARHRHRARPARRARGRARRGQRHPEAAPRAAGRGCRRPAARHRHLGRARPSRARRAHGRAALATGDGARSRCRRVIAVPGVHRSGAGRLDDVPSPPASPVGTTWRRRARPGHRRSRRPRTSPASCAARSGAAPTTPSTDLHRRHQPRPRGDVPTDGRPRARRVVHHRQQHRREGGGVGRGRRQRVGYETFTTPPTRHRSRRGVSVAGYRNGDHAQLTWNRHRGTSSASTDAASPTSCWPWCSRAKRAAPGDAAAHVPGARRSEAYRARGRLAAGGGVAATFDPRTAACRSATVT